MTAPKTGLPYRYIPSGANSSDVRFGFGPSLHDSRCIARLMHPAHGDQSTMAAWNARVLGETQAGDLSAHAVLESEETENARVACGDDGSGARGAPQVHLAHCGVQLVHRGARRPSKGLARGLQPALLVRQPFHNGCGSLCASGLERRAWRYLALRGADSKANYGKCPVGHPKDWARDNAGTCAGCLLQGCYGLPTGERAACQNVPVALCPRAAPSHKTRFSHHCSAVGNRRKQSTLHLTINGSDT